MSWSVSQLAGLLAVGAPALLIVLLGLPAMAYRPLPEKVTGFLVRWTFYTALIALAVAATTVSWGRERVVVDLGTWAHAGSYHLAPRLLLDSLSLPFAFFTTALCGLVGGFAHRYMHREPGYNRFFVMLAMFATGMQLVILAGGLEVAFIGWELIGLSSAMLVAFFYDRELPVKNGLRIFAIYRVGDVAMLCAAVLVHHALGSVSFDAFVGTGWPDGGTPLGTGTANAVALLLLLAAMVKSAQVPFSAWLPRAMEGPTPSSAIFYGALSVHAGAYLLLRCGPLLEASPLASAATVAVGVVTAVYATVVARAQTDIKSALAFGSLTQVAVILVEIGLGLRYLALVHIIAHACLRALQFLRAPSILHDIHEARNAIGGHAEEPPAGPQLVAAESRRRLYRLALERGYLDAWMDHYVIAPFARLFHRLDRLERRLCARIGGKGEVP